MKLTFYLNEQTGEASMNKADAARLRAVMKTNPVLAADWLRDVKYDAAQMYNEAKLKLLKSHDTDEDKADQKYAAQMLDGCEDEDEQNAMLRHLSQ